jgi:hypothetical protein
MFRLVEEDNFQYFLEPTEEYYNLEKLEGKEFINKVCPEYSYGHLNKICFIRIYPDCDGVLHISHFNNYVRNYYTKNKKELENPIFKGLGTFLLKCVLIKLGLSFSENTKVMLDMVDTRNKSLVRYYESLSFYMYDEDNFHSDISKILAKLKN